jgi:hypothetical protein
MAVHEKRKHTRFSLHYQIRLKFRSQGRNTKFDGITRNLSICGVLLESASHLPKHRAVDFTIAVEAGQMICPIAFAGTGKVVRIDPNPAGLGYVVALKCVHPIECHRVESNSEKIGGSAKHN